MLSKSQWLECACQAQGLWLKLVFRKTAVVNTAWRVPETRRPVRRCLLLSWRRAMKAAAVTEKRGQASIYLDGHKVLCRKISLMSRLPASETLQTSAVCWAL